MKYVAMLLSALLLAVTVPASAEKGQGPMNMDEGQMMQGKGQATGMSMEDMADMPMMREHMKEMQEHMQQMMSGDGDMATRMGLMQDHMQKMQRHMEMMQHMMEMMHGDGDMMAPDAGK